MALFDYQDIEDDDDPFGLLEEDLSPDAFDDPAEEDAVREGSDASPADDYEDDDEEFLASIEHEVSSLSEDVDSTSTGEDSWVDVGLIQSDPEPEAVPDEFDVSDPYNDSSTPVYDHPGITGNVNSASMVEMEYPCLILEEDAELRRFHLTTLRDMVMYGPEKDVSMYVFIEGEMGLVGKLSARQVLPAIELLGRGNVRGYLEEGRELEEDLIYALGE